MQIQELAVRFTENAEEEVIALVSDLRLIRLAEMLRRPDIALPAEYQDAVRQLLAVVTDLFSTSVPSITSDPEETLRIVSRDINLARLLRERGLFRLYRLVNEYTTPADGSRGVPIFMSMLNPLTGSPFGKQEDFIGWFCDEAHVARSLVFMRLATISRLIALGFSLDECFSLVITKPYAIREVLNMVGDWNRDTLVNVDPNTMLRLADKVAPDSLPEIENIVEAMQDNPDDPDLEQDLKDAAKPVIVNLLNEFGQHDRAKDALDWVKHDLLQQPEIDYTYDPDGSVLNITLHKRSIDTQGVEYTLPPITIPFVPDTVNPVPAEIIKDLIRRLPIKNRNALYLDL
jgi:hypothetical protein